MWLIFLCGAIWFVMPQNGSFQVPASFTDCLVGVAWILYGCWIYRWAVTLTPTEAVVRACTRRRVAWSQVQSVTLKRSFSSGVITLRTADAREIRLPTWRYTRAGKERALQVVETWWVEYRGPDWRALGEEVSS